MRPVISETASFHKSAQYDFNISGKVIFFVPDNPIASNIAPATWVHAFCAENHP